MNLSKYILLVTILFFFTAEVKAQSYPFGWNSLLRLQSVMSDSIQTLPDSAEVRAMINDSLGADLNIRGQWTFLDTLDVKGSMVIEEELKVKELFVTDHAHAELFSTDSAATTISSAGTFQNMTNAFTATHLSLFTFATDTLTFIGTDSVLFYWSFDVSAQSGVVNNHGTWELFENGTGTGSEGLTSRDFKSANQEGSLGASGFHAMVNGDKVHIRFTDTKAATWGLRHIHFTLYEIHRMKRVSGG